MQLKDKVVIVTGAATHIGQAYAVRLAQEGAKVVACDILDCGTTAEMVMETGGEVLPLITDVTKEEDTIEMARKTVERFGRIDCIVNNAGIFDGLTARPMMDVDMAEWDKVYEVNVKGMFLCCRAVFPYMKAQGGGKIINVGSGIWLQGSPGIPHYVSSKAAVMGLTRTLAKELGQFNINVNTLAPGGTDSGAKIGRGDDAPVAPSRAGRSIPRIETPEDLTGTMVFLASEDSNFITGQMITINGGDALH